MPKLRKMLAIMFTCTRFEAYVFGRDMVTVETDHKLLVTIALKPLHAAPRRLQRMVMKTQKYRGSTTRKENRCS